MTDLKFTQYFEAIEDTRVQRHKLHQLSDILLLVICGSICGAESWEDFEIFGHVCFANYGKWVN